MGLSFVKELLADVLVRVSVAVMKHCDQKNLGRKELFWFTV